MKRSREYSPTLAPVLLLTLTLTLMLCGSAAAETNFSGLVTNGGKITTLKHIVQKGGQVYASGFLCKPEWTPVPGVNIYTGGFAVMGDAFIFTRPQGTGGFPTELYRSDLRGGRETAIARDLDSDGGVWVVGTRIVYATLADTDTGYQRTGVFWYNVKESKSTRLLNALSDEDSFSLLSADNDHVYYRLNPTDAPRRVRWDGTGDEAVRGLEFPFGLYAVEGQHYYCASVDYSEDKTMLSRYSIEDGAMTGTYFIDAGGILALKDGFVYYGNKGGLFKMDMNSGQTTLLAPLAPKMPAWGFGFLHGGGVSIGNDLYFSASYEGSDSANTRLYKVPLSGGTMEYLGVEWFQS